jgi:hypothetical protein
MWQRGSGRLASSVRAERAALNRRALYCTVLKQRMHGVASTNATAGASCVRRCSACQHEQTENTKHDRAEFTNFFEQK